MAFWFIARTLNNISLLIPLFSLLDWPEQLGKIYLQTLSIAIRQQYNYSVITCIFGKRKVPAGSSIYFNLLLNTTTAPKCHFASHQGMDRVGWKLTVLEEQSGLELQQAALAGNQYTTY